MSTSWRAVPGLAFGGDYNPEQWPRETWVEDIRLMKEAKVNLVTVGVFSWGLLETADGVWDFGWLDDVLSLLHEAGIAVDLATPTASPPIWLHQEHPEILPMNAQGRRYHQGGRLQWCPSNAVWQRYATRIASELGRRYATHPAVRLWHVSNELGGGNRQCFCDESTVAFRLWLRGRYGDVDALNRSWGTAFWGHNYTGFDQVIAPLDSESAQNPGLLLDFARFSSDALLAHFRAEKQALRQAGVTQPITTNLMVGDAPSVVDYATWVDDVDFVANDHYTIAADPDRARGLSFAAARSRGLAKGQPWFLMEHSTGAVNWQSRNRAKDAGEMIRNSLAHIAHGSESAMFFQWRASASGSEQWHSAMVPHAGTDTRIWREVVELGSLLGRIGEVAGSAVTPGQVAVLADDLSGWAWEPAGKPLNDYTLHHVARRWRDAMADLGVSCDVVPRDAALEDYRVIVVPALYLTEDSTASAVKAAAHAGATVLITHLSGAVDGDARVRLGGYPGAFTDLIGVFAEEYLPLQSGEGVVLDNGYEALDWAESLIVQDAEVIASYSGGRLRGQAAITRRGVGEGTAWYCSTDLDAVSVHALAEQILDGANVTADLPAVPGVEAVRRVGGDASWLFLLNHNPDSVEVPASGFDLARGSEVSGTCLLDGGAVAVIREA